MDINWLVNMLLNGERYTAHTDTDTTYEVVRPPTSLSIKAANIIKQQSDQLQLSAQITQNLQKQLTQALEQIEMFQKAQPLEPTTT
jgi:hypothetical protein